MRKSSICLLITCVLVLLTLIYNRHQTPSHETEAASFCNDIKLPVYYLSKEKESLISIIVLQDHNADFKVEGNSVIYQKDGVEYKVMLQDETSQKNEIGSIKDYSAHEVRIVDANSIDDGISLFCEMEYYTIEKANITAVKITDVRGGFTCINDRITDIKGDVSVSCSSATLFQVENKKINDDCWEIPIPDEWNYVGPYNRNVSLKYTVKYRIDDLWKELTVLNEYKD